MSEEFKEKLRSLSFVGQPVGQKVTVDRTDTAWVKTTEKNESQDVHVTLTDAVRPHTPEMTRKHWKEGK